MIRLLGRQTSGNVQKVIFCLEELCLSYTREDYGRQFGNTLTDAYRKLNPNAKVPTMIDGDLVIWESHTILRYLAAVHGPMLTGATPAERTMVERWMDWLLGALNTPYVAVFKDAKKAPAERAADFSAQAADLVAQLKILDGHIAGRNWFALDRFTIADIALGTIVLLGGWLWLRGEHKRLPWQVVAVAGGLVLAGILFLAWSLSRQHDFSAASPVGVILNWFRGSVKWVIYELERGSGQVQNVFSKMNPLAQFLFVVGYGVVQPVLPPAFFEPTTLTWHIIAILRAAGWYLVLPLLLYAPIAAWRSGLPPKGATRSTGNAEINARKATANRAR